MSQCAEQVARIHVDILKFHVCCVSAVDHLRSRNGYALCGGIHQEECDALAIARCAFGPGRDDEGIRGVSTWIRPNCSRVFRYSIVRSKHS